MLWLILLPRTQGIPIMAVSSLSGIEGVLQQMRAVAAQAQGGLPGLADPASRAASAPVSFAEELARSIKRVSDAQNAAAAQAQAFELGDSKLSLSDVMIDLQKASLGFQTAVQVRSRLVQAYRDISTMAM
jgi:flagellar hook-basal body complex protein FliE